MHVKHKYSRRKGETRAQKEDAERWLIRLKTTTEIRKQQVPLRQSGTLKLQPTNMLHSPIPFRPQVTHLKRQGWLHLYSVPPPPLVLLPTTEVSKQQRDGVHPLVVTSCLTRTTSPKPCSPWGQGQGPAEASWSRCLEKERDAMGSAHTCDSDAQLCHNSLCNGGK